MQDLIQLPAYQRSQRISSEAERFILNSEHGEQYRALPEDQKVAYREQVIDSSRKRNPELFQVKTKDGQPLVIETKHGNRLEGKKAEEFLDLGSGRAATKRKQQTKIIQEKADPVQRPLLDPESEYILEQVNEGELTPDKLSTEELEEILPLIRFGAPDHVDNFRMPLMNELSKEGIEPGTYAAKSVIRGTVPQETEQFVDKVFDAVGMLDNDTARKYERWRKVYGDIDEDFRAIGSVLGIIIVGNRVLKGLNAITKPGKMRLLSKLTGLGLVDSAYAEQLPGITAEFLDAEGASKRALTFLEGMMLGGMFDMGPAVVRKLAGKNLDDARKVLIDNGARDVDSVLERHGKKLANDVVNENQILEAGKRAERQKIEKGLQEGEWKRGAETFRKEFQDSFQPIKTLQRADGIKVSGDASDPYLAKRLASPKSMVRQEKVGEEIKGITDEIFDLEKTSAMKEGDGDLLVNRYLESLHAPERNAFLKKDGAAGMTDSQAKDFRNQIEGRKDFPKIKAIADRAQKLNNQTLDVMLDGQLISQKTYDNLKSRWENYVPLQRVMDDMDDSGMAQIMSGGGPGANVQGSGLKKAVGSERERLPILENISTNLQGAIRRAERNKSNLVAYEFWKENKDKLEGLIDVRNAGKKTPQKATNLYFLKNGQKKVMDIKDPKLAEAFQHMNNAEMNWAIRMLLSSNRYLGRIYTGWNPDFPMANKIRDLTEATVNSIRSSGLRNMPKIMAKTPQDMSAIFEHSMGMKTKGSQRYQRLIDAGGSTGGLSHVTFQDTAKTFESLRKNKAKSVRGFFRELDYAIDKVNMIFEDSTRLSVFESALDAGKTERQAALAARDSSFDPLLRGKSGNLMSAAYLFYNPAVQSARNMMKTLSTPKGFVGAMAPMLSAQVALDRWNRTVDPEYRQKLSGYERTSTLQMLVPKEWTGSEEGFGKITIPLGYGLLPMKIANDYGLEVLNGDKSDSPVEMIGNIGLSVLEGYNPLGGGSIESAATPVPLLQMVQQVASNKDGRGNDIRPGYLEREVADDSEKYFEYTADTKGGKIAISIAKQLSDNGIEVSPESMLFWYRGLTGGPGKTVLNLFELTSDIWEGKTPEPNNIPILRRHFSITNEEIAQYRLRRDDFITKEFKEYNTQQLVAQRELSRAAHKIVRPDTAEERQEALNSAMETLRKNPTKARYFENQIKQEILDLSGDDRRIRQFGVTDGGRAKLYLSIKSRMAEAEWQDYMKDQVKKGLMTNEVMQQILMMDNMQPNKAE